MYMYVSRVAMGRISLAECLFFLYAPFAVFCFRRVVGVLLGLHIWSRDIVQVLRVYANCFLMTFNGSWVNSKSYLEVVVYV